MFHLPGRGTTALTVKVHHRRPRKRQHDSACARASSRSATRAARGSGYCALVPQTLLFYYDDETSDDARGIIDLEYYGDVQIVEAERYV